MEPEEEHPPRGPATQRGPRRAGAGAGAAGGSNKKVSKAVIISALQQRLNRKLAAYQELVQQNQDLKRHEEVLVQQVMQQGDNLHFVALAACQCQAEAAEDEDLPSLAKTLMQDLQVHDLLRQIGASSSSGGGRELFTTQRLRAAVTVQRVAEMRQATVEQVVARLKALTMRMCMLLAAGPGKAHFMTDTIEAVVDEYGELGLLLHVAADKISMHIGTMNLETLQVQEPPPGYWEAVADCLELQREQVQGLAACYQTYRSKSRPVIAALHETVRAIRAIIEDGDDSGSDGERGSAGAACAAAAANLSATSSMSSGGSGGCSLGGLHTALQGFGLSGGAMPDAGAGRSGSGSFSFAQMPSASPWSSSDPPSDQRLPCLQVDSRAADQQPHSSHSCPLPRLDGSAWQQPQPQPWPPPPQQQQEQQEQQQQQQQQQQQSNCSADASDGPPRRVRRRAVKPWQQFGLVHGALTVESAEQLEALMSQLLGNVMKLREMHRSVTFHFLNTLTHYQQGKLITWSWPWWSRPLTIVQYVTERHAAAPCDGKAATAAAAPAGPRSTMQPAPSAARPSGDADVAAVAATAATLSMLRLPPSAAPVAMPPHMPPVPMLVRRSPTHT